MSPRSNVNAVAERTLRNRFQRARRWITEPDDESIAAHESAWPGALARLGTRTALLLVVFVVLQKGIAKFFVLGEPGFAARSMLWECLRTQSAWVIFVGALLSAAVVLRPRLRAGWSQFEGGHLLRWLVGGAAAVLAWAGAGYAYNAYFDQAHLIDRGVVLLLAALTLWRPVFALPFVASFWIVSQQIHFPDLGYQSLEAEFKPVASVLILFSAAFWIRAVLGGRKMHGFVFLTLCLVAANFWVPALGKLRMGWLLHDRTGFMLAAAYTHGWLAFLQPETIASISRAMSALDWSMRAVALLIECGALFFFVNERTAKWLLVLFTALLGLFFLTIGYFFWKWMTLQILLLVLVFWRRDAAAGAWRRDLFTLNHLVVSLVVIGGASRWFAPARLAWWDTPLANTIRYEAVGRSGATFDLPPGFFAPYESEVAMASFVGLLTPQPVLTGAYGATHDAMIAAALVAARTPDDVIQIENATPLMTIADDGFAKQFDAFVRRTVAVSNRSLADGRRLQIPFPLRAPPFICTFARENAYRGEEPIAAVRLYRVSSFFDGKTYIVFRNELLRTIEIESRP